MSSSASTPNACDCTAAMMLQSVCARMDEWAASPRMQPREVAVVIGCDHPEPPEYDAALAAYMAREDDEDGNDAADKVPVWEGILELRWSIVPHAVDHTAKRAYVALDQRQPGMYQNVQLIKVVVPSRFRHHGMLTGILAHLEKIAQSKGYKHILVLTEGMAKALAAQGARTEYCPVYYAWENRKTTECDYVGEIGVAAT